MSMQHKRNVIAVDDDEINLMILIKTVEDAGYEVKSFASGVEAWDFLQQHPDDIDIAVLDKMMPGTNGLDLLKLIKGKPSLKAMPVILQTGDVGVEQMREGLENGACYYLTKPFHPGILTAILHSAANECTMREELMGQMSSGHARLIGLMQEGEFMLKTHEEANVLAATLSQAAIYPEFVALGLGELLANAIEHGNLDIGYDVKRKCLLANSWAAEIAARMNNPLYGNRVVRIRMDRTPTGLHVVIRDEGKGFDWRRYMYDNNEPSRYNEPNGRGVAKAMIMLDDIRYAGDGNEVHCHIGLPAYLSMSSGIQRSPVIHS